MDPLVILITAMVVLGLSQISLSYEMRRAQQRLAGFNESVKAIGSITARMAQDAGWTIHETADAIEMTAPTKHD